MADYDNSRLPVRTNGDYDATTNVDPASGAVIAHDRVASPSVVDQNKRVTAVSNSTTHALDIALHDESGAAFSGANPLPVSVVNAESGTPVHDYQTSAAVAAGASVNHDYTVTALMTLMFKQVLASGSGKIKVVTKIETGVGTAVFTDLFPKFNSVSTPSADLLLDVAKSVAAGVIVRRTITNNDNQAQDVYSLLVGLETA